jgi:hypothetical protein
MEIKLALVKMITLLFRESQIIGAERSDDIINLVNPKLKNPKLSFDQVESRESINHLKSTLNWMLEQNKTFVFTADEMLTRLRCGLSETNNLIKVLENDLTKELDDESLKLTCSEIRNELRELIKYDDVKKIVSDMGKLTITGFTKLTKEKLLEDVDKLIDCLQTSKNGRSVHEVARLDPNNSEGFKDILLKGIKEESGTEGIQYGLQGLNRMFGHVQKMRYGEWWHVYALPHNFKSGLLIRMFIDALLYNKPPEPKIKGKKPAIVRISFENEAHRDIIQIFEYLYTTEFKKPPCYNECTIDFIQKFVYEKLGAQGWEWRLLRFDPSEFTYRDLFEELDKLENEGLEIKQLTLDYLAMINKGGCAQGPAGFEVRDLIRRVRNFCSRKGIIGINPHQLSTEAKSIIRGGFDQRKFLQEVEGKGYFADCRAVDNEPDGELYIHIYEDKKLNEKWLMFRRGKHRKVSITPMQDLEVSYKLHPLWALPIDIHGPDKSYAKPGGLSRTDSIDNEY